MAAERARCDSLALGAEEIAERREHSRPATGPHGRSIVPVVAPSLGNLPVRIGVRRPPPSVAQARPFECLEP